METEREIPMEFTLIMPCLNEEKTLPACISKAKAFLDARGIKGEVLVADNGSSDRSVEIAQGMGARVVAVEDKGYGNALRGGIADARGQYIIMGDADNSYDFSELDLFVTRLREGYDLVMGNRFRGGIQQGAMPALHRYLGNPLLSFVGRLFFRSKIGDFHCGLRGFSKAAYKKMALKSEGMEFASEIVIKASLLKMRITEVPIVLSPDGRDRKPHLRSWHDGWRHLKLLLMYCPRWLFLYPGVFFLMAGIVVLCLLLPGAKQIGTVRIDIHTLFYMCVISTIGLVLLQFYLFGRVYGDRSGYYALRDIHRKLIRFLTIERGLLIGGIMLGMGMLGTLYAYHKWQQTGYADLDPTSVFRIILPSGFALINGIFVILGSFFIHLLRMR